MHLATVVEILQSIKQSEMSPMLSRIYGSDGGVEVLDVLMKFLCVAPPLSLSLHFPALLQVPSHNTAGTPHYHQPSISKSQDPSLTYSP